MAARVDGKRSDMWRVGLDAVVMIVDQGHWLFDDRTNYEPTDEEVRHCLVRGIHEPVTVWKEPAKDGGRTLVVDGRHRYRILEAARADRGKELAEGEGINHAEWVESLEARLPILHHRGDRRSVIETWIASNEHRHDDSPINRARKCKLYLNSEKKREKCPTISDAARLFNVTEKTIRNWMDLAEAPLWAQKVIDKGQAAPTAVMEAIRGKDSDQEAMAAVRKVVEKSRPADKEAGRKARAVGSGGLTKQESIQRLKRKLLPIKIAELEIDRVPKLTEPDKRLWDAIQRVVLWLYDPEYPVDDLEIIPGCHSVLRRVEKEATEDATARVEQQIKDQRARKRAASS